MTKRERVRVVSVLRLAAHLADEDRNWPPIMCEAERLLGYGPGRIMEPSKERSLAEHEAAASNSGYALGCAKDRAAVCRQAAARLESGEWPPKGGEL